MALQRGLVRNCKQVGKETLAGAQREWLRVVGRVSCYSPSSQCVPLSPGAQRHPNPVRFLPGTQVALFWQGELAQLDRSAMWTLTCKVIQPTYALKIHAWGFCYGLYDVCRYVRVRVRTCVYVHACACVCVRACIACAISVQYMRI